MSKNDKKVCAEPAKQIPAPSGLHRMAAGAAWMIGARWAIRGIGLVSTVILARLLRPEDFGLVAMGAITVQFVLVFANAGQGMAVIRNVNATDEHFDTAWTMSIAIGIIVATVLVAVAPLAGLYFHEARAVAVIQVIALKPFINGFTNVGILSFRKDLRFDKDFQFLVIQKLSTFVAGIPLAFILRSYWALVIALVSGEVFNVLISYRMSPYRPRLRLTKLREIWTYSAWMQVANIGSFFDEQADQFVVGGLAGAAPMGLYNVAADSASAPTDEIVAPITRALFPFYATLLHQPSQLAEAYLGVLSTVAVIALSTGIGVALVAEDLVVVVLGQKWLAAAPLVVWLAVGSAVLGVTRSANPVISATGSGRLFAVRNWLFVALLAPAALVAGLNWGPVGVAAARAVVTVVWAPVMFYTVARVIPVTATEIFARLWRPVIAALAMAGSVRLSGIDAIASATGRLLSSAGLGAAVFTSVLLSFWVLAGRQPGIERTALEQAARLWRRLNWQKIMVRR
jgi:lipopolysaccharide exporter